MFSSRVPASLAPNAVTRAVEDAKTRGVPLVDLTLTNPTRAGISYPAWTLEGLADGAALAYEPEPLGHREARATIASFLSSHRTTAVSPRDIALTASTSEAYSVLFRLLCDAGDEVVVPRPSYPLFEHLASLDGVAVRPYRLDLHGRWCLDRASIDAAWSPRTRALVVVSPNNPTGSVLGSDERAWLSAWCAARDCVLIVDEVFRWYPLSPGPRAGSAVLDGPAPEALTFALDGLSKSCGLPQVKLGWIEMAGPEHVVAAARARLELVLDTYLSVGTPVQAGLPGLLRAGAEVRAAIRDRLEANLAAARHLVGTASPCSLLPPEGGWSVVLRVPATRTEERFVLDLVERDHVLVHPGYFFDFPHEAFIVLSLLPATNVFRDGLTRVLARAAIA